MAEVNFLMVSGDAYEKQRVARIKPASVALGGALYFGIRREEIR